jgi:hypothetical protein
MKNNCLDIFIILIKKFSISKFNIKNKIQYPLNVETEIDLLLDSNFLYDLTNVLNQELE